MTAAQFDCTVAKQILHRYVCVASYVRDICIYIHISMCVHVRVHSCMAIDIVIIIIATSINSAYTTSVILQYLLCMNNMFLVMLKYCIYTYAIYSFAVMEYNT